MPLDKPVYIPKNRKRQRLHGAFQGGFSAGYFNTVGSKEGWTANALSQQQTREDFMDEHDHNEWGGPQSIAKEYSSSHQDSKALSVLEAHPQNVGQRLLRVLGWRESGVYVTDHDNNDQTPPNNDSGDHILSQKRIRKIALQQQRVKIPVPKLDHCGLGYDAYENAPEFKAHKERRRKLAMERAKGEKKNVYKVADALGISQDDDDEDGLAAAQRRRKRHDDDDDPHISYETVEDFVGSRTVGGFALHEDEDDAYDEDQPLTRGGSGVKPNLDAYETVAYEHHDSDEDNHDAWASLPTRQADSTTADFGGVLSAWVQSTSDGQKSSSLVGVTSDGQPPLPGFVIGGSAGGTMEERFPGPDVPMGDIPRHVFDSQDHPLVYKALSHATQLQVADQQRKAAMDEALNENKIVRSRAPLLTTFAGLSASMNDRFAPSSESVDETTKDDGKETTGTKGPKQQVTRTVLQFAPEPLLCKRFGLASIKVDKGVEKAKAETLTREETFFRDEILSKARAAKTDTTTTSAPKDVPEFDESGRREDVHANRPPTQVFKSIFEPQSEEEGSEPEDGEDFISKATEEREPRTAVEAPTVPTSIEKPSQEPNESKQRSRSPSESDEETEDSSRREKKRRRKKKEKRKHKDKKKKRKKKSRHSSS